MPFGSADAWLLGELAQSSQKTVVVLCAQPLDAYRLCDEIALLWPSLNVQRFPDWETLPYDGFSPHQDLVSERLRTLHALMQQKANVLTVPVTTALYRLAPPEFMAAYTFSFTQGQKLDQEALRKQLTLANYSHVTQVAAPGEFCIRGGLIDLFPMGSVLPYRIDLFDDEIESIRCFDADTQRSLYPVKDVQLLPGREFPLDEDSRNRFRAKFREVFEGDPSRAIPYKDIGNGIAFSGVEYYLPLFFESTATLFDYLPDDTIAVSHGNADKSIEDFTTETLNRYKFLKSDPERPILAPEQLFLNQEEFFSQLKSMARLSLNGSGNSEFLPVPNVEVNRRANDPVAELRKLLENSNKHVVLCADSAGRKETLLEMLHEFGLKPETKDDTLQSAMNNQSGFSLVVAPLDTGFYAPHANLVILTENDLYPNQVRTSRRSRRNRQHHSDVESMVRDLSELREGDPVVHTQHGIGRYMGLMEMDLGEGVMEFLHLEYAKGSNLYVPVSNLHLIARYSGSDPDTAPLHQLGSGQWDKAKRKAAKQVRDAAAELLALYARRAAKQGHAFKLTPHDYLAFAQDFGFEETPDQAAAIEAVRDDMLSSQPMDRLVCGDVGFGKTEVALRAAFIAVMDGRQVAVLCPTTLLAEQHAQTFRDRFAGWPVNIAELSRFRSSKQVKDTLAELASGKVDIVIGTHKLLSKDVKFDRLGLVVIDEEHRFGVRQKESLKALRSEVDVLTLTATPIPRTLSMSLEGIRDLSVIATAPQKRLAVKTFVRREDGSTIREGLLRELKRGGQAYFLHNEVETIQNRLAMLQELVPEARIGVAHGQMPERELESVMKAFYQQRYNVLLCTTIIETGIDVPTANTIIIHRADRLGLAQLHQIRGRVGRSHHQAYAYLLTPGEDAITNNAKKRLEAIQSMEELGAGFFLAMHDLEIRGTGEVLGEAQSGNIHEIGFSMYADMLNAAVKALKAGEEPDLESPFESLCEVNLHVPALLPSDYCPDVNARLGHYKTLASARNGDDLINTREELIDRYGKLPEPAENLIATHRLRLIAEPMGINKIDAGPEEALIQFKPDPDVDPVALIELVQQRKDVRLSGPDKLRITMKGNLDATSRANTIMQVLKHLHNKPG